MGGQFQGAAGDREFLRAMAQNLDFSEVALREIIEQGEIVVATGTSSVRAKGTGKAARYEWVHIFKYNQGRLVFAQECLDTAALVLAMS